MAGRSGSPGDQHVRRYPSGGQPGGSPGQQPGYGYPPSSPPGTPGPPAPYDALFGGAPPTDPRGYGPPGQGPHDYGPQGYRPGPSPTRRSSSRRRLIDYPRSHRTGFLRWLPSWKLLTGTGLTLVLILVVGLLAAYAATPVPPIQPITEAQTTTVLYSDGSPLTKFAQQNRTIVSIDKMSEDVQWATIAAEDRTFYANKGVSPIGIVRAAWNNARGRDLQGGSTITQQYVKNTRINNSRTWQRKIKEFFIAIKINNETPKKDILADYLNTIYFGRNTYGIEAASQAYFGHPALTLNVPESAYLAGIINGPELYDVKDSDPQSRVRAKARFQHVLEGLVELKQLTPEAAAELDFQKEVVNKVKSVRRPNRKEDDQTVYLEQMVKAEMLQICQNSLQNCKDFADVSRGGYTIRTTFDRKLIAAAVTSVHDSDIGMGPRKKWPAGTQVGLVSLDPRSGAVRAIYGGEGSKRFQSAATQDAPQAGSIYKPFTLLAALEGKSKNGSDGISLRSRFSGRSPFRYDTSLVNTGSNKVTNFGGEQFGTIDLTTATEHSVNTVYAQLNQELGGGTRTRDAARRAGLPSNAIGTEVSNTLGNGNPTAVDMAGAYGTIAAEGMHNPYYVIESVKSPKGGLEYSHNKSRAEKAFSKNVTADATYALQQVVRSGTGNYVRSHLGRPAAGKTGTVGGNGRETMAAWFVGFTPQLSTSVVIHRVGPKGETEVVKGWGPYAGRDMQGGMFPVRVWTTFMKQALQGQPELDFPDPEYVGEALNPAPEPTEEPSPSVSPSPSDGQGGPGAIDGNGQNGQGDGQGNGQGDGNGASPSDPGGQGGTNTDTNTGNGQNNGQNNGNGQDGGGQPTGATP